MKTYVCDPERNAACGKELCFERGGPCGITDRPEFALRDLTGRLVEIVDENFGGDDTVCQKRERF